MLSTLVICYLFVGGAGAGLMTALCVLECLNLRRRFGNGVALALAGTAAPGRGALRRLRRNFAFPDTFFVRGWITCGVALALAILLLAADLGKPEHLLALLFSPSLSAIAVGAYALGAALALAVVLAVCACAAYEGVRLPAVFVLVLSALGVLLGVVAMLYTGILLSGMASVAAWQTPLVVVLFALSSLSSGCALACAVGATVEARQPIVRPFQHLAHVDTALICLEALTMAAYAVWCLTGPGTAAAARELLAGGLAPWFWFGLVTLGMVVPAALEFGVTRRNYQTRLACIGACVLAGAFFLRWCIAGVSETDATQVNAALMWYLPLTAG